MLTKIFGPKRGEVAGERRTLHRGAVLDVLRNKYYSGDQIEKNEMGGTCGTYGGEERCVQRFCGEK